MIDKLTKVLFIIIATSLVILAVRTFQAYGSTMIEQPRSDLTIIQLEMPAMELGVDKLHKYFDIDISQNFEEEELYIWSTIGMRKNWWDASISWSQALDPAKKGTISLSFHFWF